MAGKNNIVRIKPVVERTMFLRIPLQYLSDIFEQQDRPCVIFFRKAVAGVLIYGNDRIATRRKIFSKILIPQIRICFNAVISMNDKEQRVLFIPIRIPDLAGERDRT